MVRHILADGTVLSSIEGHVVPPTGKTEAVYQMLAEIIVKSRLKKSEGDVDQISSRQKNGIGEC